MKRTRSQLLLDIVLGVSGLTCLGGAVYKFIDVAGKPHAPQAVASHSTNVEAVEGGALGVGGYGFYAALAVLQSRRKKASAKPACHCNG